MPYISAEEKNIVTVGSQEWMILQQFNGHLKRKLRFDFDNSFFQIQLVINNLNNLSYG